MTKIIEAAGRRETSAKSISRYSAV